MFPGNLLKKARNFGNLKVATIKKIKTIHHCIFGTKKFWSTELFMTCTVINDLKHEVGSICRGVYQGVKKISKIVINRSILIIKYAVERLDKNKHF